MEKSDFPLGTVIAERQVTFYDQAGKKQIVTVRLPWGSPKSGHRE